MNLFDEIQGDILSANPLSTVLRKSKVLAYRLKNQEFKDWVEHELNGYYGENIILPEYRTISSQSYGSFINMRWQAKNVVIPVSALPHELAKDINQIDLRQGIKEIESQIETLDNTNNDTLRLPWPAELLPYLSDRVYQYMNCYEAWTVITKGHLVQILDTTRNKLLTFILELAERYPDEARAGFNTGVHIPDEQIRQVFNYYVMGGTHNLVASVAAGSQGGDMAIFDQRNQQVNYQYNAAGNINLDNVQNRVELIGELEKLKGELSQAGVAGVIDAEIVTDAEYQLTKAVQQSQKPEPNRNVILDHLGKAKSLLDGIVSAAGIVTAIAKAVELVDKLF